MKDKISVIFLGVMSVCIVLALAYIPTELCIAAFIGCVLGWILVPIFIIIKLSEGIDKNDYIIEEGVEKYN